MTILGNLSVETTVIKRIGGQPTVGQLLSFIFDFKLLFALVVKQSSIVCHIQQGRIIETLLLDCIVLFYLNKLLCMNSVESKWLI